MALLTLVSFIAGIILLIAGAELLVRGASRLAVALGVTPLVVGLTVVAFGTGSPELAVGLKAAFAGEPDLTVGNVVGSNIFNVLFILGVAAVVAPLVVSQQLVRLDVPLMIIVSLAMFLMGFDGEIGRTDGALLFISGLCYTWLLVNISRRETFKVQSEYEQAYGVPPNRTLGRWPVHVLLILIGLALLFQGSDWLVDGAVEIATALGVSELIIGLTVIAAGTSLPEVATSVIAGMRGERDIAVGNVVGSNLFNILVVLGVSGIASPIPIAVPAAALHFDVPVMIAAAMLCLPIFFVNYRIGRWEGALFVLYYLIYAAFVVLKAAEHDAVNVLGPPILYVVLPLTLMTVALPFIRELLLRARTREQRRPGT